MKITFGNLPTFVGGRRAGKCRWQTATEPMEIDGLIFPAGSRFSIWESLKDKYIYIRFSEDSVPSIYDGANKSQRLFVIGSHNG